MHLAGMGYANGEAGRPFRTSVIRWRAFATEKRHNAPVDELTADDAVHPQAVQ
jgi:hypothetical protein